MNRAESWENRLMDNARCFTDVVIKHECIPVSFKFSREIRRAKVQNAQLTFKRSEMTDSKSTIGQRIVTHVENLKCLGENKCVLVEGLDEIFRKVDFPQFWRAHENIKRQ